MAPGLPTRDVSLHGEFRGNRTIDRESAWNSIGWNDANSQRGQHEKVIACYHGRCDFGCDGERKRSELASAAGHYGSSLCGRRCRRRVWTDVGPRLGELLGTQIVIENVGGAGGMTGVARVAAASPDGYQFVLGNVGTHAMNQTLYKNPPYNAATDFAPVARIAESPQVLVTRKDFPADDLQTFIAYAKANESKLQYGSAGTGSPTQLACALLNTAIGINITHVPYRGGAPAMLDLIAGRIDYQCPNAVIAIPQIESKQIKALAALSSSRSSILPTLKSAQEQGLAGFAADNWIAFFLPKHTPAAIVQKLHDAIVAAIETPSVQERLKDVGAEVVSPERRSPEYLKKFVEAEIAKWAAPIKAAGLHGG